MPLINCQISLQLKCSKDCVLLVSIAANENQQFE